MRERYDAARYCSSRASSIEPKGVLVDTPSAAANAAASAWRSSHHLRVTGSQLTRQRVRYETKLRGYCFSTAWRVRAPMSTESSGSQPGSSVSGNASVRASASS
eukprot:scaffold128367_cov31-Tisochrysis_lutea.AAC.1